MWMNEKQNNCSLILRNRITPLQRTAYLLWSHLKVLELTNFHQEMWPLESPNSCLVYTCRKHAIQVSKRTPAMRHLSISDLLCKECKINTQTVYNLGPFLSWNWLSSHPVLSRLLRFYLDMFSDTLLWFIMETSSTSTDLNLQRVISYKTPAWLDIFSGNPLHMKWATRFNPFHRWSTIPPHVLCILDT